MFTLMLTVASFLIYRTLSAHETTHSIYESTTPDGAPMSLYEHDGAYSISFQGVKLILMHSSKGAKRLLRSYYWIS